MKTEKRDEAKGIIRNMSTAQDPQLVRSFRGHTGGINAVNFDPKMKQIASASDDGIVYVWSFKPQQRPFKFVGHKGPVHDVQFSPDGETIASSGDDRQIRLWKNSVQNKCKVIKCHAGAVRSIHYSNDGGLLLSASDDKTLKIWNTKNLDKKFVASFPGHKNWVKSGQFTPDNRIIGSGSDDKTVRLWDVNSNQLIHSYDDHTGGVNTVRFTPDGTCLASGSKDRSIKIFDIRSNKLIQHYDAHEDFVNSISFHPSGYYLTSASKDSKIKVWDLRHGKLAWTLYSHTKSARAVSFNQGGDYFVSGGDDNLVMIWKTNFDEDIDVESIKPVTQIQQDLNHSTGGMTTQTLFKSNKINSGGQQQQNTPAQVQEQIILEDESQIDDQLTGTFGQSLSTKQQAQQAQISEALSGSLEGIVNQLSLIQQNILKIDGRISNTETAIKKINENDKVQDIIDKFDRSQQEQDVPVQQAAWESFQEKKGFGVAPGSKRYDATMSFGEKTRLNDNESSLANTLQDQQNIKNVFMTGRLCDTIDGKDFLKQTQ